MDDNGYDIADYYTIDPPVSPMYTKINAEVLSIGEFEPFLKDYSHVVAYERRNNYNKISIICNFQSYGIKIKPSRKHDKVLIYNYDNLEITEGTITLQPFQAVVIKWC